MNISIVYGSKYGTAKRYAEELAKRLNTKAQDVKEVKSLDNCDVLIHVGGLYAGFVKYIKKANKLLKDKTKYVVVTCGISNPKVEKNVESIKNTTLNQVPKNRRENTKVFSLFGAIDYGKLNKMDSTMMGLLVKRVKSLPEDKQTEDTRILIESYGKQMDYTCMDDLNPVVDYINSL